MIGKRRVKLPLVQFGLAAFVVIGANAGLRMAAAEEGPAIPPPAVQAATPETGSETAVFAGGCFWGVQGVFQHVIGVRNAVSGYAGGKAETAKYRLIGTGRTGHAEAVRITYDPRQVSYGQLMQIYFSVAHDPTELDRQGPDVGPQYRSTVFPADAAQAFAARAYIAQLNGAKVFDAPIATTIEPGRDFYPAEDEHQDFMAKHPAHPYILAHDAPKIENLKRLFPDRYRAEPVLVARSGMEK